MFVNIGWLNAFPHIYLTAFPQCNLAGHTISQAQWPSELAWAKISQAWNIWLNACPQCNSTGAQD